MPATELSTVTLERDRRAYADVQLVLNGPAKDLWMQRDHAAVVHRINEIARSTGINTKRTEQVLGYAMELLGARKSPDVISGYRKAQSEIRRAVTRDETATEEQTAMLGLCGAILSGHDAQSQLIAGAVRRAGKLGAVERELLEEDTQDTQGVVAMSTLLTKVDPLRQDLRDAILASRVLHAHLNAQQQPQQDISEPQGNGDSTAVA